MSVEALAVDKVAVFLPVSHEMMVDSLWFTTRSWPDGEKAAEHLRYGQSVTLGVSPFTAADVAENIEHGAEWDGDWFLPYLDWPDER